MFWSFCAPKGGVGTSVVAASVAVESAKNTPTVLVDFGGDVAQILGVDTTDRHGVNDWLAASGDVGVESLNHLEIEVAPNLVLMPRGSSATHMVPVERATQLVHGLNSNDRTVIADVGVFSGTADPRSIVCVTGDRTTCVIRACYLALAKFKDMTVLVDDVVEIEEPGRALRTIDIEAVVAMEVSARIPYDPAIARLVDAGLLQRRMPRALRRNVRALLRASQPIEVGL